MPLLNFGKLSPSISGCRYSRPAFVIPKPSLEIKCLGKVFSSLAISLRSPSDIDHSYGESLIRLIIGITPDFPSAASFTAALPTATACSISV